ncbi:MAG: P-loop NTPase [Desulfurococcaceae archaeon]
MKYYGRDPRIISIPRRLEKIKRVIAFMSNKGGVGKTVLSTITALSLVDKQYKTGLLDLDFVNPSTHVVLGVDPSKLVFEEEKGIKPPVIHGIEYISITLFTKGVLAPLRGEALNEVFAEILSITNWGELDYLIIDTPPGFSDEHLDLINYIDKLEVVIVSTPSSLSIRSVENLIDLMKNHGVRINGLIENMSSNSSLKQLCLSRGIRYLGNIPYDPGFENSIGFINKLKETIVWRKVSAIVDYLSKVTNI